MSDNKPLGRMKVKCRISFPKLAAPENTLSSKSAYSVQVRIPKEDTETMTEIRRMAKMVWEEKFKNKDEWPPKFKKENFFKEYVSEDGQDGWFIRDGDESSDEKGRGFWFFTAYRREEDGAPVMCKRLENGKVSNSVKPSDLYSGCNASVSFNIYAFNPKGINKKGLSVGLNGVCFESDNERWSNNVQPSADEFGEVDENDGAEDAKNYDDVPF